MIWGLGSQGVIEPTIKNDSSIFVGSHPCIYRTCKASPPGHFVTVRGESTPGSRVQTPAKSEDKAGVDNETL